MREREGILICVARYYVQSLTRNWPYMARGKEASLEGAVDKHGVQGSAL